MVIERLHRGSFMTSLDCTEGGAKLEWATFPIAIKE